VLDRAIYAAGALEEGGRIAIRRDRAAERVTLVTDPDRLTQVFINLISNAQKYCDARRRSCGSRCAGPGRGGGCLRRQRQGHPGPPAEPDLREIRAARHRQGRAGRGAGPCDQPRDHGPAGRQPDLPAGARGHAVRRAPARRRAPEMSTWPAGRWPSRDFLNPPRGTTGPSPPGSSRVSCMSDTPPIAEARQSVLSRIVAAHRAQGGGGARPLGRLVGGLATGAQACGGAVQGAGPGPSEAEVRGTCRLPPALDGLPEDTG
jgi:hypothetical protein